MQRKTSSLCGFAAFITRRSPLAEKQSRFTSLIAEAGAKHCIYGHLHGQDIGPAKVEGEFDGVTYACASCDQINFTPMLVADLDDLGC